MQQVDSAALVRVSKALGLSTPGSQFTDFDDQVLQQVLDVAPIIRRSRALGAASGLFTGSVENVHGGAGVVTTDVNPYAVASPRAGYPSPVPDGFDVWLLDAFGSCAVGLQGATASRLLIVHPAVATAFGPTGTVSSPYRLWDSEIAISAAVSFLEVATGAPAYQAVRIPRGALLRCSTSATGVGSMFVQMVLGLFPEALGQDGVG